MGFRRKDPELELAKSHEKMVAKLAANDSNQGWIAALSNELASARAPSSQPVPPSYNQTVSRAQSQYVLETAMDLESSRPSRGRQSAQPDGMGHGRVPWFHGGIFSARRPNMSGQLDYGRWPETSMPPRGTPTEHVYRAPVVHNVVDTRGRDGCPGCPQC